MRQWVRILARVAAGVSLVLCMAFVVLWVRSYWRVEGLTRDFCDLGSNRSRLFAVGSDRGLLGVSCTYSQFDPGAVVGVSDTGLGRRIEFADGGVAMDREKWVTSEQKIPRPTMEHWWEYAGVHFQRYDGAYRFSSSRTWIIIVRYWLVFLLSLIWPSIWAAAGLRRRRRMRQGRCRKCGYDLRASPERCPECGAERIQKSELRNQNSQVAPR